MKATAVRATGALATASEHASAQAQGLLADARSGLEDQVAVTVGLLAETLRRLGEEGHALLEGRPEDASVVGGYVRDAAGMFFRGAERASALGEDIRSRGLDGLLLEIRRFAPQRPGVFLLGAASAGFATARSRRWSRAEGEPPARGTQVELRPEQLDALLRRIWPGELARRRRGK